MIGDLWPVLLVLSLLVVAGFAYLVYELRRRAAAGLLPPQRPPAIPQSRRPGDILPPEGLPDSPVSVAAGLGVGTVIVAAIAALGRGQPEWVGAGLALAAAAVCAVSLLQRIWARDHRGTLLLDLGRPGGWKRYSGVGVFEACCLAAGVVILLLPGTLRDASPARQVYMGASVGSLLSASLLFFFLAFSRLQACEAGLWLGSALLKWDRLESYAWEEDVLWLQLRSRPSGGGQVGIVVAPEHREALESIVSARLPAAPARTEPA